MRPRWALILAGGLLLATEPGSSLGADGTVTFDAGTVLGVSGILITVTIAIIGWEWHKISGFRSQIEAMVVAATKLHTDALTRDDRMFEEQAEEFKKLQQATRDMTIGIDNLTHYIRWLGQQTRGIPPEPPLPATKGIL